MIQLQLNHRRKQAMQFTNQHIAVFECKYIIISFKKHLPRLVSASLTVLSRKKVNDPSISLAYNSSKMAIAGGRFRVHRQVWEYTISRVFIPYSIVDVNNYPCWYWFNPYQQRVPGYYFGFWRGKFSAKFRDISQIFRITSPGPMRLYRFMECL